MVTCRLVELVSEIIRTDDEEGKRVSTGVCGGGAMQSPLGNWQGNPPHCITKHLSPF